MESTRNYHAPVARLPHDDGLHISAVNAILVHSYGNNNLRRVKTDKKDSVKLANSGLHHCRTLPRYVPAEDTQLLLKNCYQQYQDKKQSALFVGCGIPGGYPLIQRFAPYQWQWQNGETLLHRFWHRPCISKRFPKTFSGKYLRCAKSRGTILAKRKSLKFIPKRANALALCLEMIRLSTCTVGDYAALRWTSFLVMGIYLQNVPLNEPVVPIHG